MTKEEIIKYVTSSPENTNPNILKGMLDEMGGGSSGGAELTLYKIIFQNLTNLDLTTELTSYSFEKKAITDGLSIIEIPAYSTIEAITFDSYNLYEEIYANSFSFWDGDIDIVINQKGWECNYFPRDGLWSCVYNGDTPNTADVIIQITLSR